MRSKRSPVPWTRALASAPGGVRIRTFPFRDPVDATFVTSAARPDQFPAETLPEIAFLGRSNVGKSSLVNCLTGQQRLAFTSAKPGCTQSINFYRIDGL